MIRGGENQEVRTVFGMRQQTHSNQSDTDGGSVEEPLLPLYSGFKGSFDLERLTGYHLPYGWPLETVRGLAEEKHDDFRARESERKRICAGNKHPWP